MNDEIVNVYEWNGINYRAVDGGPSLFPPSKDHGEENWILNSKEGVVRLISESNQYSTFAFLKL